MNNIPDIEKIVKERFQHFEAEVSADSWDFIRQRIASPANGGGFSSNKFLKWGSAAVVVGIITSTYYILQYTSSPSNVNIVHKSTELPTQDPKAQNQESILVVPTEQTIKKTINNIPAKTLDEKRILKEDDQVVLSNKTQEPENIKKDEISKSISSSESTEADVFYSDKKINSTIVQSDRNTDAEKQDMNEVVQNNSDQEKVAVYKINNIPNIFTPNGDGENDYFCIPKENVEQLKVFIYNSFGMKVAELNTVDDKWDGANALAGVYSYSLEGKGYDGKKYRQTGLLKLIR